MTDWMFQANPKRYDLLAAVAKRFSDDWSMNQHRQRVAVGDRILFFLSGAKAGIYAQGRVVGPVYEAKELDDFGRWKVDIEYEGLVDPPLLRPELLADPVLATWGLFKGRLATNFMMPTEVAERLTEKLKGRTTEVPKPVGMGFDPSVQAVDRAIAEHQATVRKDMLVLLANMPPSSFEELVRVLLESLGYEDTAVVGQSGDMGVDVVATLRLYGMTSVPTIIQAKRWTRSVDGDVVRQLRGALHVNERGVVITTSRFTKQAIAEAEAPGKSPIGLVDGATLVDLLIERSIGVVKRQLAVWRLDPERLLSPQPGPYNAE